MYLSFSVELKEGAGYLDMIWRIWKCDRSWLMRGYYGCVIGLALGYWALAVPSSAHISNFYLGIAQMTPFFWSNHMPSLQQSSNKQGGITFLFSLADIKTMTRPSSHSSNRQSLKINIKSFDKRKYLMSLVYGTIDSESKNFSFPLTYRFILISWQYPLLWLEASLEVKTCSSEI